MSYLMEWYPTMSRSQLEEAMLKLKELEELRQKVVKLEADSKVKADGAEKTADGDAKPAIAGAVDKAALTALYAKRTAPAALAEGEAAPPGGIAAVDKGGLNALFAKRAPPAAAVEGEAGRAALPVGAGEVKCPVVDPASNDPPGKKLAVKTTKSPPCAPALPADAATILANTLAALKPKGKTDIPRAPPLPGATHSASAEATVGAGKHQAPVPEVPAKPKKPTIEPK